MDEGAMVAVPAVRRWPMTLSAEQIKDKLYHEYKMCVEYAVSNLKDAQKEFRACLSEEYVRRASIHLSKALACAELLEQLDGNQFGRTLMSDSELAGKAIELLLG